MVGHTCNLRAIKENLSNGSVRVTVYVHEGGDHVTKVAQVIDHGQLGQGTPFVRRQGDCQLPIDQLRIDNWPEKEGTNTSMLVASMVDARGSVDSGESYPS
jgi:hypothetical protein